MEKSYIKTIDSKYLEDIGITNEQIEKVSSLVNQGIEEHLYSKSLVPYHNIKHIERVIMYAIWILNLKKAKGEKLSNTELLLWASLYHDSGRSLRVSNKSHGVVGAQIAREKLKNKFEEKDLDVIEFLIETHAKKTNLVDFKNKNFSDKEKENIQILSDILKDADALDRNRIKLFSFAQCKVEYLRTKEAKEIYKQSDTLLKKYEETIKK